MKKPKVFMIYLFNT